MRGFNFVPVRSYAYFPEWKPALIVRFNIREALSSFQPLTHDFRDWSLLIVQGVEEKLCRGKGGCEKNDCGRGGIKNVKQEKRMLWKLV